MKNLTITALTLCLFFGLCFTNCDASKKAQAQMVTDPYITFDDIMYDFGTMKLGEQKTHEYPFVITANEPVTIELVSGCECTDLEWPEGKTFQPGEKGSITATFVSNREEERGDLEKTIDILLTNIDPQTGYQVIKELKYKVKLVE